MKRLRKNLMETAGGVFMLRTYIVNVFFIGEPDGDWVLLDGGLTVSSPQVIGAAKFLFGKKRPQVILLTHGHFDHVGAVVSVAGYRGVPVYAHENELPFLSGRRAYPPADPFSGGGLMSLISPLYPRRPISLGSRLHQLPHDHSVPGLPGWQWVPTPGHTPGHVSFFRKDDRFLAAGDAFTTTRQESAWSVITQRKEISGPPSYFTPDWLEAWESVKRIASLRPDSAVTGHGLPMEGDELRGALDRLAAEFDEIAIPRHGRYAPEPLGEQRR